MKNNKIVQGAALALVMGTAGNAFASMGNIGTTYGVLPTDVASAQALSMFNTKVSSVYYNPAYLARTRAANSPWGFCTPTTNCA